MSRADQAKGAAGNGAEPAPAAGSLAAHIVQWLVLSLPYILAQPASPMVQGVLARSALINSVLFVVPGIPFAGLLAARRARAELRLRWLVPFSLLVLAGSLVAFKLIGVSVTAGRLWNTTWAVTSLGCIVAALSGAPVIRWRVHFLPHGLALSCLVAAYLLIFVGATRVVPILGDHDDELQGTAFGLVTHLTPSLRTGRGTDYVFAHPPLAHVYVAGALTYYDQLDWLAGFDSRADRPLGPDEAFGRFLERPLLAETRTPSVFFSAATVALLVAFVRRRSERPWLAALAGATYLAMPEVLVRSSYAGYFAAGSLFAMAAVSAGDEWTRNGSRESWWSCAIASSLLALTDHKMLLLPAAVGAVAIWQHRGSWLAGVREAGRHPIVIGFAGGTLLFWLYGFLISPQDFWTDHVRHHLVDRVMHRNARGMDLSVYPGLAAMWWEFLRDTGYVLLPVGGAAAILGLLRDSESENRKTIAVCVFWAMMTAVAFSVVDWRQTKHLAPLLLPVILISALVAARRRPWIPVLLAAASILACIPSIFTLWTDFRSVIKVPEW